MNIESIVPDIIKLKNEFMKTIYIILIAFFVFDGTVKADPTLIGVWGVSKGEDASFEISQDSIYYLDSNVSVRYSVIGDSIFINMAPNDVYRAKYILRNDSLILIDDYQTSKFVRFVDEPTIYGSFTMQPGFSSITSGINYDGHLVSFYIAFIPDSTMQVGVKYLVANISANCRPSVQQNLTYNGDKTWEITIDPNGDIYFKIICCSSLSGAVSFGTRVYALFGTI